MGGVWAAELTELTETERRKRQRQRRVSVEVTNEGKREREGRRPRLTDHRPPWPTLASLSASPEHQYRLADPSQCYGNRPAVAALRRLALISRVPPDQLEPPPLVQLGPREWHLSP